MQTSLEPLEGNKVRLHVTIPAEEFEKSIDLAYSRFAQQMRIPGFRPGKAPRRIIEQSIPVSEARAQALKDSLADYYVDAVGEHVIDVIAAPTIDITSGEESGDIVFTAEVEVRPEVRLTGYDELTVVLDIETATPERVEDQIDSMRQRFATLEDTEDALTIGGFARLDIAATIDGEAVPALSAQDFVYEVGSGILVDELDEAVRGSRPGAELSFSSTLTDRFGDREGQVALFTGSVKSAQVKVLPELTDEWVDENTESATVEALRTDMALRIDLVAKMQAQMSLRDRVLEELVSIVPIEAPLPLVEREMERRLHDLAHRLEQQGMTIPMYLEAIGQSQDIFVAEVREGSTKAVLVDLGLRSIIAAEEFEASDEEFEAELERILEQVKGSPKKARRQLEQQGVFEAVRFDIERGKALQFLVDNAKVVDAAGNTVDLSMPEPSELSQTEITEAQDTPETDTETPEETA
ncbi:MAG: trigger factor [Actinobacteria bacterium]|uniref:peptidylprolyl isomerase n=1 Tax=freshwater metagenome TaxID=449393 RepID=A0A6J6XAC0_9ZZZZ|nr:trigger factor [Actinomycetota bacterium]MSW05367.1 trigger factor [Actinomycetota bacterium]MSX32195.1 trigger factor [Actinomycetota bacterium]MSX81700.1 trigger factor [Actinomycetota bacterium]MSY06908.1 trigger factor [Actinomycetota bacterium]